MKKNYRKITLFALLIGVVCNTYSQTLIKPNIKEYDDTCFCGIGISHPYSIIKLDNNFEILLALQKGKTLTELDNLNVSYKQSQIFLLKASELVKKKDSVFYSLIPILTKDQTKNLRLKSKEIAQEIVPLFKKDYKLFDLSLKARKMERSSFTLFFAYILDDLVWRILEGNEAIEDTKTNTENPFWNGVMWFLNYKRDFTCGTNSMSINNTTISVNWSDNSKLSVSNYNILYEMLQDYIENGLITKKNVKSEFLKNNLFDDKGELQIPIIKNDSSNIFYKQSQTIAKIIANYLETKIDYNNFQSEYLIKKKSDAIIILYHEIMWDILNILESENLLKKPVAFENPNKAKQSDLKDLIFIIEN